MCIAAPNILGMTMRARPALDRSIQMPIDPPAFGVDLVPCDEFDASWPDRWPQTGTLKLTEVVDSLGS
jgi:hypothetical protein